MDMVILPGHTYKRKDGTWGYTVTAEMRNGVVVPHVKVPMRYATREHALDAMFHRVQRLNQRVSGSQRMAA